VLLSDSVGLALLVVLETLAPAERLAFVLHDMFAVPFDEIAPMVGRSPTAARQLASRARRRVQGAAAVPDTDLRRQREVVDAFFAAARDGDFDARVVVAPHGRPFSVMGFTVRDGRIVEIDGIADPERLARLDLAGLDD
jgi:RNA polymerase sigma-70 factor (ECF subfamily)